MTTSTVKVSEETRRLLEEAGSPHWVEQAEELEADSESEIGELQEYAEEEIAVVESLLAREPKWEPGEDDGFNSREEAEKWVAAMQALADELDKLVPR